MPVWRRSPSRLAVRLREASGHLRGWFGVPWNASLPIWRYRRSGRLLQPASPRFASLRLASRRRAARAPSAGSRRFPRLGQCPAGGHAALQDGVGGRATVMDSQFFPIYYRTSGSPVRKLPSDARYPAFRADSGDCLALEGVSEPSSLATVIYRKFSSIPLPYPEEQGDAGGRRRAIAGLHGAVPPGCASIRCGPGNR